jgi:hypothetical protein
MSRVASQSIRQRLDAFLARTGCGAPPFAMASQIFEVPLCHWLLVCIDTSHCLRLWQGQGLCLALPFALKRFSVVTPVIPRKSTKVRYISLLSSGDGVGIRSMKFEVGLGRHVVNPGSPHKAIIPEDHWGVRFLHILPDGFFQETNV